MLERSLSNTQIFSKRDIIAFPHFETLDNISTLCLGTILNIKITNKKKKKREKCDTYYTARRRLTYSVRTKVIHLD